MSYQCGTIAMSIENFNDVTTSPLTPRKHDQAYSTDLTLVSDIEMESIESDFENSETDSTDNASTSQENDLDDSFDNERYSKPLTICCDSNICEPVARTSLVNHSLVVPTFYLQLDNNGQEQFMSYLAMKCN